METRGSSKRPRLSLSTDQSGQTDSSTPQDNTARNDENDDHPFLNDQILKRLFKYIKPYDLLACRGVCKKWNETSIPLIRLNFEVTVYGTRKTRDTDRTVQNFVKDMSSNTLGIPFAQFRLGSFCFVDFFDKLGQRFIELFGKSATRYDLSATGEEHMVENVAELLRSSPNLESFVMPCHLTSHFGFGKPLRLFRGGNVIAKPKLPLLKIFSLAGKENPAGRRMNCPTFFKEFFKAARNVSTFDLRDSECTEPDEDFGHGLKLNTSSLDVLTVLENLQRQKKIVNLMLSEVTDTHLESLRRMSEKGLKLKGLEVGLALSSFAACVKTSWFEVEAAKLFNNSLISLRLNHINSEMNLSEFPQLSELKLLDMRISKEAKLKFDDFNNAFPTLETLGLMVFSDPKNLHEIFGEKEAQEEIKYPPNLKMKTLSLRGILMRCQTFQRTLIVFPNLKELELDINLDWDQILYIIWTQMTGLVKLSLSGTLPKMSNVDLDFIFTGISTNRNREIESRLEDIKGMTPEIRKNAISRLTNEFCTVPSISNLKNLRYLRLSVTDDRAWRSGGPRLTDMTGYFGLYSLKRLRHLFVRYCEFSKTCSEVLANDLGLDTWIIQRNDLDNIVPSRGSPKFPATIMPGGSQAF